MNMVVYEIDSFIVFFDALVAFILIAHLWESKVTFRGRQRIYAIGIWTMALGLIGQSLEFGLPMINPSIDLHWPWWFLKDLGIAIVAVNISTKQAEDKDIF